MEEPLRRLWPTGNTSVQYAAHLLSCAVKSEPERGRRRRCGVMQFDSDYSGGGGASYVFIPGESLGSLGLEEMRILLIGFGGFIIGANRRRGASRWIGYKD